MNFRSPRPFIGLFSLVAVVLAAMVLAGVAVAQEEGPSDDEVNAIAKGMYCPVCENVPLDVCPTQACAQWREVIRDKLAAGWSEAQIKDYFVEQYGDRVLAVPPPRGINWLVFLIPPLVFIGGIYLLVRVFRSWRLAPVEDQEPMPPDPQDDEYVRRLEEELEKEAQ
jgi:cytochrome c-type biogenesis protein CcmH